MSTMFFASPIDCENDVTALQATVPATKIDPRNVIMLSPERSFRHQFPTSDFGDIEILLRIAG
jgi:hypothetical protein